MRLGISVGTRKVSETSKDEIVGMITGTIARERQSDPGDGPS